MLHVKAEHHLKDLDDSDDLDDDERKSYHHGGHGYHPHHLMMKGEMHKDDCGVPLPATKPKIWSLADTAACKTPPPPSSQPWCGAGGSGMGPINGFALPSASAPYSRYSGFFNGGPVGSSGFPEVQTDTPPQTPPNMKLPNVAGNIIPAPGSCFGSGNPAHAQGYQQPQGFGGYPAPRHPQDKERHEYLPPQHHPPPQAAPVPPPEETAFKPFYKK